MVSLSCFGWASRIVLGCCGACRFAPPFTSLPFSPSLRPCSVLVHSGGVHGGHYYAFIRPDGQKWIRFDDDRVELVDSNRAVDDQFGECRAPVPEPIPPRSRAPPLHRKHLPCLFPCINPTLLPHFARW